jgi:hypothetical protein
VQFGSRLAAQLQTRAVALIERDRPLIAGWGMTTKSDENRRIGEVLRLLNVALDDCHRLLGEAEAGTRGSNQDNDPPSGSGKPHPRPVPVVTT